MRALFRHIRRQPSEIRERYAFGIAASFTGVVVLLWAIARFDGPSTMVPTTIAEQEKAAFSTLVTSSKEQWAKLKNTLAASVATSSDTQGAQLPAATDPSAIVLTPEEVSALQEQVRQATGTATSTTPAPAYIEVMIGTTTASTTGDNATSSVNQ